MRPSKTGFCSTSATSDNSSAKTRVKGGSVAKNRRRKVLKQAKGYFGSKHRLFKTAQEQVFHSGKYAYRDRKNNKRNFRKLWITRINAGCRANDISYSKFIDGLNKAGIEVNRKMLSEAFFSSIVSCSLFLFQRNIWHEKNTRRCQNYYFNASTNSAFFIEV